MHSFMQKKEINLKIKFHLTVRKGLKSLAEWVVSLKSNSGNWVLNETDSRKFTNYRITLNFR